MNAIGYKPHSEVSRNMKTYTDNVIKSHMQSDRNTVQSSYLDTHTHTHTHTP